MTDTYHIQLRVSITQHLLNNHVSPIYSDSLHHSKVGHKNEISFAQINWHNTADHQVIIYTQLRAVIHIETDTKFGIYLSHNTGLYDH